MRYLCLLLLLAIGGCNLGIDPDSLVRDLRVLGARIGPPDPGSLADVDPMKGAVHAAVLLGAPTGPGRSVPTPRPLTVDFYFCAAGHSLILPGSLDPACTTFSPGDPDPASGPAAVQFYADKGLIYFTRAFTPMAPGPSPVTGADLPFAPVQGQLAGQLGALFAGGGGAGGGGADGGFITPTQPLALQLPVLLRVNTVPPTADTRDSETAFTYARLVVVPPGVTPPPPAQLVNHNPVLLPVTASGNADGSGGQPLSPCPQSGPCQRLMVHRAQEVYFTARSQPGSVEHYIPLDESGRGDTAETLRYTWFSTDGQFSEERTGDPQPTTKWTNTAPYDAPGEVSVVQLWVVVQDDRGGTDWQQYELQFVD